MEEIGIFPVPLRVDHLRGAVLGPVEHQRGDDRVGMRKWAFARLLDKWAEMVANIGNRSAVMWLKQDFGALKGLAEIWL